MIEYRNVYAMILLFVFCTSCKGQNKTDPPKDNIKSETKDVITYHGPNSITRNIIQDRKGNLWMASWEGVFRYDGQAGFTNMTSGVSSARFFSLLEDRKGNFWFGTIGSGVYHYDGVSLPTGQAGFQNFTTMDGLVNNEIVWIYEDKAGNIWFGAWGGASRYNGKSFRNYIIKGDSMMEDRTGKTFPNSPRQPFEVNAIIEDKTGKFWLATRGNTFVYDARLTDEVGHEKTFTVFRDKDGKPFKNVRTIIEDKKGNIWLSGNDGLWRYDGSTFTNFTTNFVGYIYEDKSGNIWTTSQTSHVGEGWTLSRYDRMSLSNSPFIIKPTEIKGPDVMLFGILEAYDGSIWVGGSKGVYRYDGVTFSNFKGKEGEK